jgi:hypothetical protein
MNLIQVNMRSADAWKFKTKRATIVDEVEVHGFISSRLPRSLPHLGYWIYRVLVTASTRKAGDVHEAVIGFRWGFL